MSRCLCRECGCVDLRRRNAPAHITDIRGSHSRFLIVEIRDKELIHRCCAVFGLLINIFVDIAAVLRRISRKLIRLHLNGIVEDFRVL